MGKNGTFDIDKLLGTDSTEKTTEKAGRVWRLKDIDEEELVSTSLDPGNGRTTTRRKQGARFGPSGHLLQGPTEEVIGECVHCREEYDRAGEPEKLTVVPRAPGGGGICAGCQRVFCCDHASVDDDGQWWCEDCEFDRDIEELEGTVFGWLFDKVFGGDDD